jgi:hypothetical protein
MTARTSTGKTNVPGSDPTGRLILTVRLYPAVHGVLIEEFSRVGWRLRAARAAHLMMVGLLHERAHASAPLGARLPSGPGTAPAIRTAEQGISPEDAAFVSAIVGSA